MGHAFSGETLLDEDLLKPLDRLPRNLTWVHAVELLKNFGTAKQFWAAKARPPAYLWYVIVLSRHDFLRRHFHDDANALSQSQQLFGWDSDALQLLDLFLSNL